LLHGFIRHVKHDLEAKFEAGGSATLTLIEVNGGWDSMVAGNETGDQLTEQLFDYLTTNLRRIDRVVRYGRVTLMAYMPGRSAALARAALNLLQQELAEQTGLSICVGLATYPDDGASFTELVLAADQSLTQARARESGTSSQEVGETDGRPANAYKILIADDDPFLVTLLQATFTALGYQSIAADNGRDAIELIHRERPDLVILDNLMPQLSGFELLEQLRSYYQGRLPVPVIMLTMMTAQDDIIRGFELGVEDYIGKPFNPRELIARVERVLASQPSFLRAGF
jgi:PleD family two-component response regulator